MLTQLDMVADQFTSLKLCCASRRISLGCCVPQSLGIALAVENFVVAALVSQEEEEKEDVCHQNWLTVAFQTKHF